MGILFLTDGAVKRAKNGEKRQLFLWDEAVPGFGVRVYATGKKTFVFRCYEGAKRTIESIGPFGVLTTDQARKIARERLQRAILRDHEVLPERTFADLAADYLENYAKKYKRSWMLDFYRLEKHVLPALGEKKIKDVTRLDVERLHTEVSREHPTSANRIVGLVSSIYSRAIEWGEAEHNPARAVRKNDERARDIFVTKDQFPKLQAAIEKERSPVIRGIINLLFLTGLRKSELLGLRWDDIDFERKLATIPDTKNGRPHHVPLTVEACRIFYDLPRTGAYVFTWRGRRMLDFRKSWYRVRKAAGLEHLRVHDIRRTVGSWLAQEGYSLHLIGEVLNHRDPRSTRVYARFQKEHVREALENLGKVSETNVR